MSLQGGPDIEGPQSTLTLTLIGDAGRRRFRPPLVLLKSSLVFLRLTTDKRQVLVLNP